MKLKIGNGIEPYFEEYYKRQEELEDGTGSKFRYFVDCCNRIGKFKAEKQVSIKAYIELTMPIEEILLLDGMLRDFIGSQGICKLKSGDWDVKLSKWQNNPGEELK